MGPEKRLLLKSFIAPPLSNGAKNVKEAKSKKEESAKEQK